MHTQLHVWCMHTHTCMYAHIHTNSVIGLRVGWTMPAKDTSRHHHHHCHDYQPQAHTVNNHRLLPSTVSCHHHHQLSPPPATYVYLHTVTTTRHCHQPHVTITTSQWKTLVYTVTTTTSHHHELSPPPARGTSCATTSSVAVTTTTTQVPGVTIATTTTRYHHHHHNTQVSAVTITSHNYYHSVVTVHLHRASVHNWQMLSPLELLPILHTHAHSNHLTPFMVSVFMIESSSAIPLSFVRAASTVPPAAKQKEQMLSHFILKY